MPADASAVRPAVGGTATGSRWLAPWVVAPGRFLMGVGPHRGARCKRAARDEYVLAPLQHSATRRPPAQPRLAEWSPELSVWGMVSAGCAPRSRRARVAEQTCPWSVVLTVVPAVTGRPSASGALPFVVATEAFDRVEQLPRLAQGVVPGGQHEAGVLSLRLTDRGAPHRPPRSLCSAWRACS